MKTFSKRKYLLMHYIIINVTYIFLFKVKIMKTSIRIFCICRAETYSRILNTKSFSVWNHVFYASQYISSHLGRVEAYCHEVTGSSRWIGIQNYHQHSQNPQERSGLVTELLRGFIDLLLILIIYYSVNAIIFNILVLSVYIIMF